MKFEIASASRSFPIESCGLAITKQFYTTRWGIQRERYIVEIESLEELLSFMRNIKQSVIIDEDDDLPLLTIYDDYVE